MGKIVISFDEKGLDTKIDGCKVGEVLMAARFLDLEATKTLSNSANSGEEGAVALALQTAITGLKILLLPFNKDTSEQFDREAALKNLPLSLSLFLENLEKQMLAH